MTDHQQIFDGIITREPAPAAPSTESRLAHLGPTVLRIRTARYRDAVLAYDEAGRERGAIRKRWREILDLIADNPLKGDDAFLNSAAAGRRLAQLADPEYEAQVERFATVAGASPVRGSL